MTATELAPGSLARFPEHVDVTDGYGDVVLRLHLAWPPAANALRALEAAAGPGR